MRGYTEEWLRGAAGISFALSFPDCRRDEADGVRKEKEHVG
jgi:hypothetical protein